MSKNLLHIFCNLSPIENLKGPVLRQNSDAVTPNKAGGSVVPLPASLRKPVTLAPHSRLCRPPALSGRSWRRAGCLPLPTVPAPCAGTVAAFWAVRPSSTRRLWSVAMVCSTKVLNCSSVSGMVSGSSFSINPMRTSVTQAE